MKSDKNKTWSREVGAFGLLVWAAATYRIFFAVGVEDVAAYENIYNGTTATVWLSVTALFTAKRVTRHLEDRGRPPPHWEE